MKVGIDLVKVDRFSKMKNLDAFLQKHFSDGELNYISQKKTTFQTIAGLFAAKESFLKALQIGIKDLSYLKKVEIYHTTAGAPYILTTPQFLKEFGLDDTFSCTLSISHTEEFAIAICIIN